MKNMKNILHKMLFAFLTIALADSIYLSSVEFSGVPLYCANSGIINCASVLSSKYAFIFGVPLAYYALLWAIVAFALFFIKNKRIIQYRNWFYIIAIGAVIYSFSSMFALGEICEYCSVLDASIIGIFIITIYSINNLNNTKKVAKQ